MKLNLTKENKKVALCSISGRTSFNSVNVKSVDLWYSKEMLENIYGRHVDVVSALARKEGELEYYKDINKTDLNDYDEVWVYAEPFNAFGGVIADSAITLIEKIANYNNTLYCIVADPKILCTNYAQYLKLRVDAKSLKNENGLYDRMTDNVVEEYTKRWNNVIVAFGGRNYEMLYTKYMDNIKTKKDYSPHKCLPTKVDGTYDWVVFPIFDYYALNEKYEDKIKEYSFNRKYDLVYFGNNRGGDRNKKLKKYFDLEDLNVYLIGFDMNFKNCNHDCHKKYVKHDELFPMICENAYATVVVGDVLHDNNFATTRFFEAMLLDVVGFIDESYDPEHKFIRNEELAKFIYINNGEQLKSRINEIKNNETLFRSIITLEREEVSRIYNEMFS